MNITELEPERINNLQLWWIKPESEQLISCLEKLRQKAMLEYSDLSIKASAEGNDNFKQAAASKLVDAVEFEKAVKVLKNFFPDGPFIARIEL